MNRLEDCTPQQCIAVTKYIMTRTHIIVARYRDTEAALQVHIKPMCRSDTSKDLHNIFLR